jgi:RNA-binding protein Musashi
MEAINLRLFIGAITLETTKEMLMNHFQQFGNIKSAEIVYEKKTSKIYPISWHVSNFFSEISKGFGFVSCADQETFERIIKNQHTIDGKRIDCNVAFTKRNSSQYGNNENRKVFIGGVNNSLNNGKIFSFKQQF